MVVNLQERAPDRPGSKFLLYIIILMDLTKFSTSTTCNIESTGARVRPYSLLSSVFCVYLFEIVARGTIVFGVPSLSLDLATRRGAPTARTAVSSRAC